MSGNTNYKTIALWLFICCGFVFAMIVLGGVTRLTQSGLSMVEWDPIMGVIPPVNEQQWQETFELYQQYPEYQQKNLGMSLAEFKQIFYMEYAHRVLGRLIGIVFLLPFLFFWLSRRIDQDLMLRLGGLFVLGGLQGLLGWYMVKSGLVDQPHVSQYRLTAHLLLAVLIYSAMFWLALGLWHRTAPRAAGIAGGPALVRRGWLAVAVVVVMILSGGFVAGTKAGFAFNTFPLMAGQWLPPGGWSLEPGWRNLFENIATVQFTHRVLAVAVAMVVLSLWWAILRAPVSPGVRLGGHLMLLVLVAQITLGIATLLQVVPVFLAAAHQAGALLLLTLVLWLTWQLVHARAAESLGKAGMAAPA